MHAPRAEFGSRSRTLGIAFIPWGPLGSGDLDSLGSFTHIDGLAGVPPAQIALAWLLHRSPVMLPIPGTATASRLEENVAAAGLELTDEQYEQIATAPKPPTT